MPIIESVSVAAVAVPLDKVTSFATRTVSERHYCLVKVRGKDGNEGIGFCYVGSAGGDIAKIAVEQLLAPKLIGQTVIAAKVCGWICITSPFCKDALVLLCVASLFWIRRSGI